MKFETIIEKDVLGAVTQDTSLIEPGLLGYGQQKEIIFFPKDCDPKHIPKLGDKVDIGRTQLVPFNIFSTLAMRYAVKHVYDPQVMFNICQVKRNKELVAVDICLVNAAGEKIQNVTKKSNGQVSQGFIAALKDGFGFIETVNHDREIFFHYR